MNGNIARGRWQEFKGTLIAQWGHATGDPLRVLTGRHLQLVGALHAECGHAKVEIGRQIDGVHRRSRALYARASAPVSLGVVPGARAVRT